MGRWVRRQKNLWVISASATGYTNLPDTVGYPIPPEQISIGGFGNLDTNGNLYVMLSDNDPADVTPRAPGNNECTFTVNGQKYTLVHQTEQPALTNTNRNRTTIGVGEQVDFSGMPSDTMWSVSGRRSICNKRKLNYIYRAHQCDPGYSHRHNSRPILPSSF